MVVFPPPVPLITFKREPHQYQATSRAPPINLFSSFSFFIFLTQPQRHAYAITSIYHQTGQPGCPLIGSSRAFTLVIFFSPAAYRLLTSTFTSSSRIKMRTSSIIVALGGLALVQAHDGPHTETHHEQTTVTITSCGPQAVSGCTHGASTVNTPAPVVSTGSEVAIVTPGSAVSTYCPSTEKVTSAPATTEQVTTPGSTVKVSVSVVPTSSVNATLIAPQPTGKPSSEPPQVTSSVGPIYPNSTLTVNATAILTATGSPSLVTSVSCPI